MLLQANIENNLIFINTNSHRSQPLAGSNCSARESNPNDAIFIILSSVFYFSIENDTLKFKDPLERAVLTFKRIVPFKAAPDLSGIWTITKYSNKTTTLTSQISSNQIYFCQGFSLYNYTYSNANNSIKLTPVSVNCPSADLTKTINSVRFYRYKNGYLTFYDENVTSAMEFIYSSAYDASKPLYSAPQVPQPPAASQSTPASSVNQSQVPPAEPISVSNIAGNWSITSLFKIPIGKASYFLLFSNVSLRLGGGCNVYDYDYTLNSSTQIITVVNGTSTKKACGQSDDQLYVSGISKMHKYLLSSTNGVNTLMFYDQKGNPGYILSLSNKTQGVPTAVLNPNALRPNPTASTTKIPQPAPKVPTVVNPFEPGTYLMLLLLRRDLPRTIIKMTDTTFTYKLCDSIQQTYELGSRNSLNSTIKISGGPANARNCTKSNDSIYYNTLNEASRYTFDP